MINSCWKILAVNPGSTSTKLAVFEGMQAVFRKTLEHSESELKSFDRVLEQCHYRLQLIKQALLEVGINIERMNAVVGRGGLLKPLSGGTYAVNELMLSDLARAEYGEHASNLGAVIAKMLADSIGVQAYIVDPVSVDELEPVARISGHPQLPRASMSHALNTKAVAHSYANSIGRKYEELNLIVAHLGSGISVSAHRSGKMIDLNDSRQEGPFAPDRSGTLPTQSLVRMCFSGEYSERQILKMLFGEGGIYAYLGTKDMREVEQLAAAGNAQADLLIRAMAYQVAKEIGAQATVLCGAVDAIILTGGMAYSELVVKLICERIQFIARVIVMPGEEELDALAAGVIRVLNAEEGAQLYL